MAQCLARRRRACSALSFDCASLQLGYSIIGMKLGKFAKMAMRVEFQDVDAEELAAIEIAMAQAESSQDLDAEELAAIEIAMAQAESCGGSDASSKHLSKSDDDNIIAPVPAPRRRQTCGRQCGSGKSPMKPLSDDFVVLTQDVDAEELAAIEIAMAQAESSQDLDAFRLRQDLDAEELEAIGIAMSQAESMRELAAGRGIQPGSQSSSVASLHRMSGEAAAAPPSLPPAQIELVQRSRELALKRRREHEGKRGLARAGDDDLAAGQHVSTNTVKQEKPFSQAAAAAAAAAASDGVDGVIAHMRERAHETVAKRRGVYVLELNGGGFYVGKSDDIDTRIKQHMSGTFSSSWCHLQGGVKRVVPTLWPPQECLSSWEQNETIAQMLTHGFEKVRGFEWTKCVLNRSDCNTIKTMVFGHNDLCRRCGGKGHFQAQCGNRPKQTWLLELDARCQPMDPVKIMEQAALSYAPPCSQGRFERSAGRDRGGDGAGGGQRASSHRLKLDRGNFIPCVRCGRDSHAANSCYAKTGVDGVPLSERF